MLKDAEIIAMIPVSDIEEAKKFYTETLGLKQKEQNMAGVVYECGQAKVMVYATPNAGTSKATIATWEVKNIEDVVDDLKAQGIEFERYEMPGAEIKGDVHIWEGAKAAWFKDPFGNILGLSQM